MTRLHLLLSTGVAMFRFSVTLINTIVGIIVAPARAGVSRAPDRSIDQNHINSRGLSLPVRLLMGAVASLWVTMAVAQSHTVYVQPVFLYQFTNVQGCGYCVRVTTPWETTLAQAWADAQAIVDQTSANSVWTALNLFSEPGSIEADGIPYYYGFDVQSCDVGGGGCSNYPNTGYLTMSPACPVGSAAGNYGSLSTTPDNRLYACGITVSDIQPPPKGCKSCLGNSIYAATGQKLQVETDYTGVSGLNYTRTYRSNNGAFRSVTSQAFVDNSTPAGTTQQHCYPGSWTYGSTSGTSCFSYISVYPNVNRGVAQYQVQTADGQSIELTGPNSAVTAKADVNERVTLYTGGGSAKWQVQRDDDSIELYSAAGAIIQKTLRGGQSFTYTYSTTATPANIAPQPGLLLTQSDAFGHTLSWQYNAAAQVSQMTDPAGGLYHYSYDASGNLTGVTYPDSSGKTYWYNESANTGGANLPNALTGITDENGVRFATFQYSTLGYTAPFAVSTQHAGGVERYTFTYDAAAYYGSAVTSTVVTDPLGTARTYQFQDNISYNRDLNQIQPAVSGSGTVAQSETYDANGNPASVTDFDTNVTNTVYDLTRNLETSRTEAYGTAQARTITTQWNATWRQPALITEPNRTTAFTYDSLGNALTKTITDTTVTPNVLRTWTYTYDGYGRMLTAKGPRTDVDTTTTYAYYTCTTGYQCGQIQTITDAVGNVTTFNTYNAHGQPLTITDPNSVVTTLTYDARLRLKSRQVGTETTSYTYYPTGLLNTVTMPDGSTIQNTYDPAHRLTDITDSLGNHIHYTLDPMGNRTAENAYDPGNVLHRAHTRVINALNQLSQDINAAGTAAVTTTLGYDNDGNLTSSDAPLARNTINQYDALNRLSQITDPNSGITKLGYDANDNLATVIDPRTFTTSYSHNGFGDLTQLVSPDTGTTNNTYDSGGNLHTATDARGAVGTYSYDALNRVTQVAYTDQTINFTYDVGANGKGRLTGASDANHSLSWAYDTLGRVSGKGQIAGGVTKSVGYGYTNGDLASLVTPSGQTIVYTYTNHRIASIKVNGTTLLSGVTYDPFGPPTAWTWGNSTSTVSRAFDQDGNPHQIVTAGVTNGYTVDNASRITGISDSGLSANTWTFGFDLLDRVTSGHSAVKSRGYTYDANSNRLTTTGSTPSTEIVSTTSNRLNSTTGNPVRTYAYDTAGNTLSFAGDTFTYNQRGRMKSSAVSAGTTNYVYNALGQLIEKSGNGGTTLLVYDEAGHVLGEYSSAGTLIQETIWMDDLPVATLRPSGSTVAIYYVHTDHLGNPRKVTRPSDNGLMWRWDPDTFSSSSTAVNQNPAGLGTFVYNLRFPGQYYLAESGLHYNYYRTYDPQMGRYLESDPIGLAGGSFSTYSYGNGNPISNYDQLGLQTVPAIPIGPGPFTIPPVALPGTPEHQQFVNAALSAIEQIKALAQSAAQPNTAANCPNQDECNRLKQNVQNAKARVGSLGACRAGMTTAQLTERYYAWLDLAKARTIHDYKCFNGGDSGHQEAQSQAWSNVGSCGYLLGR